MKEARRLALKREPLVELGTDDLRAVVGAYQIITGQRTECVTVIIDPPDNTYVCSDSC